ncbi:MAG TPA: YciI family protein [Caulobacteraceae bacterium]|nr:YciI family protein [Caulobacteraceae bacterium]
MQYALLIYEDERNYQDEAVYKSILDQHNAFSEELGDRIRGGAELKPVATATTVRQSAPGAARTVHDGPFAETREQLGGFYLIEAADLDEALAWARKLPMAGAGCIEVRPVGAS